MTTKASVLAKTMSIVAILFSIGAVIMRTLLMLDENYNSTAGFYPETALRYIFSYSLAAFAIISFVMAHIYIKEGKIQVSFPSSPAANIISLICACVFGGFVIYTLAGFIIPGTAAPTNFELVSAVICALPILYFVSGKSKIGDVRAILCTGSALVLLVLVFGLYFSTEISYVNHNAVLCYGAAIFMMLTVVAEANSILGRKFLRRYIAYAPVSVVLSFALSVPDIVYAVVNLSAPTQNIYHDFIFLVLGAYHLAKLISLTLIKPVENEENNTDKKAIKAFKANKDKKNKKETENDEEAAGN